MDSHAETLLWNAVIPTADAAHKIYTHAVGEAIKRITCSEKIRSLLVREVVEQDTFPIEDETGVHTMRVPTLEEFLDHTAMHCIEITDNNNVDIMMDTYFKEAVQESKNGTIIEIVMEGNPDHFEREPFM